jgi:hypothetical protein
LCLFTLENRILLYRTFSLYVAAAGTTSEAVATLVLPQRYPEHGGTMPTIHLTGPAVAGLTCPEAKAEVIYWA